MRLFFVSASHTSCQAEAGGLQFQRVNHHMKFRLPAAQDFHAGHAGNLEKTRLQLIIRRLPKRHDVAAGTGEADANDGKGRERHALNFRVGGRRQITADLREPPQHIQLGLRHVHMPVEEDIDLGRTALGGRTHGERARNVFHRLFDGPRYRRHHFVGGHDAVVHENDDARKIGLRKNRRRHAQRGENSRQTQGRRDERDGQRVLCGEPAQRRNDIGLHLALDELVDVSPPAAF